MDYGFAPGSTAQDGRARRLFQRRANTTLVSAKSLVTVRGFVNRLLSSASITRPIDDALIAAHASSEGWLLITLFPAQTQRGQSNFETLEESLSAIGNSIAIDDTVIGHSPGDPITHNVHFKGCNIGKAPPFLTKFKEALGDNVNVTAPKHFHDIYEHTSYGTFEHMSYEFSVQRKAAFATRAALLAALDAEGFTFIDGSAVPTANWGKWVPKKIGKTVKTPVSAKLGVSIGKRKTIDTTREFRVKRRPFYWQIKYSGGAPPSGTAARQTEFETSVGGDARFESTHPYPFYERVGYSSIADFFAGHTWTHTVKKNVLYTVGIRVEYTVVVPITEVTSGNVVFNYHPLPTTSHAAITNLTETDTDFFESV